LRFGLIALLLFTSMIITFSAHAAEDPCSYCGVWVPVSQKYDSRYSSNDRLAVTEHTIALPGCQTAKSTQVFLTDKTSYGPPETARIKPLKAILQVEGLINCASPIAGLSNGALVEIELRPREYQNSEELALVVFASTTLEEIKASYTYQLVPTPPGQKQMKKSPPRPRELGGWWFIRENYDPCGEGSGRGAYNCAAIKHKKADDTLGVEWSRLLNKVASGKKKELVPIQEAWLKACSAKCAKEGVDRGYHPWGLAHETSCLAVAKLNRSSELQTLYECISGGRKDCPQLRNKPQPVRPPDRQ